MLGNQDLQMLRIAREGSAAEQRALAATPNLGLSFQLFFAKNGSNSVLRALMKNPTVSIDACATLAMTAESASVKRQAAKMLLMREAEFSSWVEEKHPALAGFPYDWMFPALGMELPA